MVRKPDKDPLFMPRSAGSWLFCCPAAPLLCLIYETKLEKPRG